MKIVDNEQREREALVKKYVIDLYKMGFSLTLSKPSKYPDARNAK